MIIFAGIYFFNKNIWNEVGFDQKYQTDSEDQLSTENEECFVLG